MSDDLYGLPLADFVPARNALAKELKAAGRRDEAAEVAKLAKPLAPGKSVALKLNKPQGCSYTVQGMFEDEAASDADMDLCRDRVIRLTE